MNSNISSDRISFKPEISIVKHTDKRNWKTKGALKFSGGEGITKLEEMLLQYKIEDPNVMPEPVKVVQP
jgi:hypothetical protein